MSFATCYVFSSLREDDSRREWYPFCQISCCSLFRGDDAPIVDKAELMATVEELVKAGPRPKIPPRQHDLFTKIATWTIRATGGRWGFLLALGSVVVWA